MSDKKHAKALKRKDKKKKAIAAQDKADKAMAETVAAFNSLPEECTVCATPFDNKSREAHLTWKVAVRGTGVRLFCVECQDKAREALGVQNEN